MNGIFTCDIIQKYDELSILEIKFDLCFILETRWKLNAQIEELEEQLNKNLGYDMARKIYGSKEYDNLYNANKAIFNEVEKNKNNEAQKLNKERFEAKKELNKVFFNEELGEIKI